MPASRTFVIIPRTFQRSLPSTQLFIVDPNSEIRANVLRLDIMLPGKVGHQNRVIVYHLDVSFTVQDAMRERNV